MNLELVLFYILAVLTVASAVTVVAARSAINSAMSLVATFFFLAGIYVLLADNSGSFATGQVYGSAGGFGLP